MPVPVYAAATVHYGSLQAYLTIWNTVIPAPRYLPTSREFQPSGKISWFASGEVRHLSGVSENPVLEFIDRQDWLQPVQETGEKLVNDAFSAAGDTGTVLKNALHGVYLKHPLHAAITDVPVGSWTAAAVLDAMEASGQDQYAPGADAAIAVGLVGAVGSALSGITDWSATQGKPQRLGAFHGLLNTAAALLYGTSYVLRKTGQRGPARWLAFAGYGIVLGSSWLGGELSYSQKIGVNHAPDPVNDLPEEFTRACAETDLRAGEPKKMDVGGVPLFLLRDEHGVHALANTCSHLGGPLDEGKLQGDSIVCPWHGSRFCLRTGQVLDGPATHPQPVLDVKIEDGQILVRRQRER